MLLLQVQCAVQSDLQLPSLFLFFFCIYKDSQFNNITIKSSKIQLQNKTQNFRKYYTFLNKVCTRRGHININNSNNNDIDKNDNMIIIYI